MLNDEALEQLMISRRLPEEARQVIRHIRRSNPSRRVESSKHSVACRYPSRKMEAVIQAESHTNELAAVHTWEHDPEVFEFWDQPPPIPLRYKTANGQPVGASHTPDYFLIGEDFIGWVECKTEARLESLGKKQPGRYVNDGGTWRCPPGEEYAAKYNLGYILRSSKENDTVLIRNLNFLEDYMLPRSPAPTPEQRAVATAIFREQPWLRLSELVKTDDRLPADAIFKLIADGDLYFDLQGALLSDLEGARVFRDEVSAEAFRFTLPTAEGGWLAGSLPVSLAAGTRVTWDGKPWQLINVGDNGVHLIDPDGRYANIPAPTFEQLARNGMITGLQEEGRSAAHVVVENQMRSASKGELAEALKRYHALFPNSEDPVCTEYPPRTFRRHMRAYREAERALGCGFVGLLPKISRRGNRLNKIDPAVHEVIKGLMEERYAQPIREKRHLTYGEFLLRCDDEGLAHASEKTFRKKLHLLRTHKLDAQRMGEKAAYAREEFIWSLEIGTPRHGERPFEIAHVDHTEMDVTLVHPITGANLGRPWLTLLIDAFTRMVLAYVISFARPDHVTCMMIVRECVRRHGRVPKILVVDGGSEFKSTYFECLLARLVITKKTRPPSKGRFGSVIERMFGVSNDEFIHNLAGNTQATRNPRSCSSTHYPERHAVWTLRTLTERFEQWLNEHYHQRTHTALGTSPARFMKSMNDHCGNRTHVWIPYTEDFVISCLPAPSGSGKVTVDSVRGVKVQGIRYWYPGLRDLALDGKELDARIDPFNRFHIYVFLNGKWTECLSQDAPEFRHRDQADIRFATEEMNAFFAQEPSVRKENAMGLAAFHRETRKKEKELAAMRRQALDFPEQPAPEDEDAEVESFEGAWNPTIDDLNETVYKDF